MNTASLILILILILILKKVTRRTPMTQPKMKTQALQNSRDSVGAVELGIPLDEF